MLEKATAWAYGESTAVDAAREVTEDVYDSGFKYNNISGEPAFEDSETGNFKLALCLSNWGSSAICVNCWDTAQMVAIFSNALGAGLQTYRMMRGESGFLLNYIKPIGRGWTNAPFISEGRVGFLQHWTASSLVYDACLLVDNDGDPTTPPHTGLLPGNMPFDVGTPETPYDDYRGLLVDPVHETEVTAEVVAPAGVQ